MKLISLLLLEIALYLGRNAIVDTIGKMCCHIRYFRRNVNFNNPESVHFVYVAVGPWRAAAVTAEPRCRTVLRKHVVLHGRGQLLGVPLLAGVRLLPLRICFWTGVAHISIQHQRRSCSSQVGFNVHIFGI